MKLRFLKQRWQRVTARILMVLTVLVLAAGFFINLYFSPILGNTIKNMVLKSSDSLYRVNFTKADLHIFQEKIVLYNIDLTADSAVYNQRKKLNTAPNNLYRVHIKKLVLTYIHPLSLYFGKKLDIDEIVLSAPELNISYQLNHTKDTTLQDNRTLYQRISKTLRSIHVGRIGLNDVQFKYQDYSGNKVVISELKEMNLSASDLLIDSASMTDKSRFLYCKDLTTEINNFSGQTLNGLYHYKMKLLTFSTRTSLLHAEDIDLDPVNPDRFFDKSKHDRFSMHMDSLQLTKFNFLSYYKYRRFSATSLTLSKGRLGVFSNPKKKKQTEAATDRSATFPNAGIYRLKTDLNIDTVLLKRIDVTYAELNSKSLKVGYVKFNNTNGRVLNLSTNADALAKNKYCRIALTSRFMNKSNVDVAFSFDMLDKDLAYSYKGHMGPVNLSVINPAAMPLGMLKIKSGKLKAFDFNITGNRYGAKGNVSLLYNDLKVGLLKPDTLQNKLKKMPIESMYANIFIIKHDNPDSPNEPARSFYVNYKRPPEVAFFKSIWKTLLAGIKSCAGVGEQKEKEIKNKMAERITKKAERKAKKEARKIRKEEKKKEKELKKRLKNTEAEEER
jgi:hypothetical protein